MDRRRQVLAAGALLVVTAIWGGTFVPVQEALRSFPMLPFLAYRFLGSAVVLAVIFFRDLQRMTRRTFAWGLVVGVFLAAGYIGQTWGLEHLSVPTVAFVTGLFVVFTPLLTFAVTRKRPANLTWLGVLPATVGLYVITGGITRFGLADLVVLASAIAFAAQILAMESGVHRFPYGSLVVAEMAVTGLICALGALMSGGLPRPATTSVWEGLAATGVLAGALAYWVQAVVQRYISGTRTAVIMTTEPLFAACTAYVWQGVMLPPSGMAGAAFIVAGVLLIEVVPNTSLPSWAMQLVRSVIGARTTKARAEEP
ncbi:MAG: DMT family transporter [Clostridia bacterium]